MFFHVSVFTRAHRPYHTLAGLKVYRCCSYVLSRRTKVAYRAWPIKFPNA